MSLLTNYRQRTTLIAAPCLVVSLIASVLALRGVDQVRPRATLKETLFIDSPKVVKHASLGYDGLMACIYWTRAVQYFGNHHAYSPDNYDLLAPLLEITTRLDPNLVVAYQFGSSFLAPAPPNGAGQPDRAIALMQYGIEHNPNDWHLYYDLGFIYYTEHHDYAKAAEAFARGARVPGAHPFVRIMAAQMAQHAGEYETARMLWSGTLANTHDKLIRQNAVQHLRALKVDEDVSKLQGAVTRFGQRAGRLPSSMRELAAAEGLRGIPVDPDEDPYKLDSEGRVLVEHPDDFPFITNGVPPGYKPKPPKFHEQQ
jgi:tetratricopeptide (TPR) repeat protein